MVPERPDFPVFMHLSFDSSLPSSSPKVDIDQRIFLAAGQAAGPARRCLPADNFNDFRALCSAAGRAGGHRPDSVCGRAPPPGPAPETPRRFRALARENPQARLETVMVQTDSFAAIVPALTKCRGNGPAKRQACSLQRGRGFRLTPWGGRRTLSPGKRFESAFRRGGRTR